METTVAEDATLRPLIFLSGHVSLRDEMDAALGGVRQRRLLAGLTLRRGQVMSPEWLNDVVWFGEEPPDGAPHTIRTYVYRLRKALAQSGDVVVIETMGGSYRLKCPSGTVDLGAFESHAENAARALEAGRPGRAAELCRAALALWRGRPLGEFADEAWAMAETRRLEEIHLLVEERHASALLGLGRIEDAIAELEGLASAEPLRERRCELLMRALFRTGRQGDALEECATFRRRLRDELGLDPSQAMATLEQRILAEDESLLRPPTLRTVRSFELIEELAPHRDGNSWRARHPSLVHDVRLDSFPAAIADEPQFVRNFDTWLRRVSRLEHPAIVSVDDHWREPGSAHVVTRLLRGRTLREALDSDEVREVRFGHVVDQIGGALEEAHADGVFHGAVSLDNVVSDRRGNWYLIGFANRTAIGGSASTKADVVALGQIVRAVGERLGDAIPDSVARPSGDNVGTFLAEIRQRTRPAFRAPPAGDRPRTSRNPYPGLRPFDDLERRSFFGRTALIEQVVTQLSNDFRLTLIIGPSGTGKSSLLHAGILPALGDPGRDGFLIARLTPGVDPLSRLAAAVQSVAISASANKISVSRLQEQGLARLASIAIPDGERLVIAVDQLEELFVHGRDNRMQQRFVEQLLAAATAPEAQVRVIATLRSDHFGGLLSSKELADNLHRCLVPVPPFTATELEAVITGPAHLAGVDVEARLVAALTSELAERPTLLPHLQHLLRHMFERQQGNILSYSAYEELGGVTGSLGRTGEALFEELNDEERVALRRVTRRLSHIDGDGNVTRRQAAVDELVGASNTSTDVLKALGRERLVVFDHDLETRAPTAEITHEALLTAWPRLAEWQREDAEITRLLEDLSERSRAWIQLSRSSGELLRGPRLDQALESLPSLESDLSEREREFLEASVQARDRNATRERRRTRRLRTSLAVAVVGFLISAVAGALALRERSDAESAAAEALDSAEQARSAQLVAEEQTAIADQRRVLASVAQLGDEDPRLGLLLAARLYRDSPSLETLSLLQETLVSLPRGFERYFGEEVPYVAVSLSDDGSLLAGVTETQAHLWDTATGQRIVQVEVASPTDVFVTDAELVIVGASRSLARVSIADGSMTDLDVPFAPRSFDQRDDLFAVGGAAGQVAVANTDGSWLTLDERLEFSVDRIHIGTGGRYLVATSESIGAPATIWDLKSQRFVGEIIHEGPHGNAHTRDAVIVGDAVASVGPDNSLQIRALPDLTITSSVQFVGTALDETDSGDLVTVGESGFLSVRGADGAERDRLAGIGAQQFTALDVAADGRTAALATRSGIEFWSLRGGRALPDSVFLDGPLSSFTPSPGRRSSDGLYGVERYDRDDPGVVVLRNGAPTTLWDQVGLPTAMSLVFVDDVAMVLSADLSLRFVGIEGDRLSLLPDLGLVGLSADDSWAYDRHGDTIAVVSGRANSRIEIVQRTAESVQSIASLPVPGDGDGGLIFSPDGKWLLAAVTEGDLSLWSTDTWSLIWQAERLSRSRPVGGTSLDAQTLLLLDIDGMATYIDLASGTVTRTSNLSTAGFPRAVFAEMLESGHLLTVPVAEVGGSARMWDLDAETQIGVSFPAVGEGGSIYSHNEMLTGEGNVAHIWPMDVTTWPEHACRIAGRDLTQQEWDDHGPTGHPFEEVCS